MQERSRGLLHKVIWYLFIWTISLWIVISASSTISAIRSCNRGRFFVNSTWGLISSGAENYREDSYCVWHIQGNSGQYVTLKFHKLQTECSYDHVFVYDGSTNSSQLLGSFSGRTIPAPVTSTTGSMVVLLFSDSNYVLEGFEGEYSITDCPLNCSSHGHCNNNACECHPGYTGTACEHEACPEDCGTSEKRGSCQNVDGVLKCVCNEGFHGLSCSLHQTESRGNSWHLLSHGSSDLSRTASGVAYVSSLRRLFVFGGYNLNTATGDLLSFNFSTSVWTNHSHAEAKKLLEDPLDNSVSTEIVEPPGGLDLHESEPTTEATSSLDVNELSSRQKRENREPVSGPSARFGHAMAEIGLGFILFGGQLSNKSLSNELWYYSAVDGTWNLLATQSKFQVPPLARHTLTVVNDSVVYIFGGNTNHGQFSSTIYRIDIEFRDIGLEQWRVVRPRGGKTHDLRLVGHSTVYHEGSRSLVIYGGIAAEAARYSKLSDRIFLFDLEELHWTEILYPRGMLPDLHIPLERAFHSASIIGQYMVIFGGYTHKHNREEVCYDAGLYFYHLGCHMWVSHHVLDHSPAPASVPGVYSHATATMDGNVLLVFGGYRGSVSSNLWAYMMPSEMVRAHGERFDPEFMCVAHRTQLSCTANPECGWCPTDGICYGRAFGTNCTSNLQTTQCPGICPALPDCLSCTIHGQVSKPKHAFKAGMGQCAWCVQTARCHRRNDNLGVCGAGMETPSGIVGWWGSEGTDITDVEECRTRDFRPGLTFLTYEHPANYSQPDELTIINSTLANIPLAGKHPHLQDRVPGNAVVARMLGFIHPLASKTKPVTDYQQEMKVMMDASYASAVLKISLDDRAENLEVVATLTANDTNTSRVEATRPNKTPIFPDPTRGNRYLMDFVTFHTFGTGAEGIHDFQREISRMQLVWNSKTNYKKIFTFEYVEPFSNGSCSTYSNCLHCLSDSLCGWCDSNQRCLPRIVTNNGTVDDLTQCYVDTNSTGFLVLTPSQCTNCSNHISCDSCVGSGLCEWMVEDSQCVRRGRFPNAVVAVEQCPIPCHKRDGCAACLGEPGRCTWCEETQTCFAFSSYTSMFQYGMCREWVDVEPPPVETMSRLHALRGDLGGSMSVPSTSSLGKVAFPPYTSVGNTGRCKSCERKQSCGSCLVELGCGWCYYSHNPLIGICTKGDFTAPSIGECSALLGDVPPGAETTQWRWSYAECPDVDECSLGHHDCHPDAACLNTPGSYVCACKKGFIGDGKTFCERTCFEECVHGHCTGPPDYQCACELGWTGSDCSQDCQCHGHSTCYQGVGKCDQCQDWTDGPNCELCRPGSYGNATTSAGCQICQCNDHGNATAGICNPQTGQCHCQDETEGFKCERCKPGYYGDARQGGTCYRQCSSRSILTSVTSGSLGSYTAPDAHEGYYSKSDTQDCIWVLGLHDSVVGLYSESSLRSGIIRLTIQQAANVSCSVNHVYVYDGLPEFMGIENGWNRQNQLLGTFCSPRSPFPVTVDAHSGIMTVFYRKSDVKQGFNASYSVMSCPSACPHNRTCIAGKCVCPSGWVGVKCEIAVCPNDCFSQLGHGKCEINYGRCVCNRDYAGLDCGQVRRASALVVTELTVPEKLSDNLEHLRTVLPRLGHSLIADHRGSLWLFGGYSMSRGPVDDIREFDTKNSTWLQVNVHVQPRGESSLPPGRYFHAAEYVTSQRGIYVYGGIGSQDFLSDFWKFDINSRRWFEIDTRDAVPPLAGHTLTLRNDGEHQTLILVGGFSPEYGFLEKVFEFSPDSGTWNVLNTTGTPPVGIYGHSAAYHISTKSLYVYGGMLYEVNKVFVSSNLYALHFPTRRWSLLTVDRESNPAEMLVPRPRYLHTAITTEDYMLIIGGLTEPYNGSDTIMAYSFACNLWIPLSHKSVELIGSPLPPMVASAASRQVSSNAIYLMGGMWAGTAKGTLLKLEVPEDLCVLWSNSKLRCKATPGCSYCGVYEPSGSNATFCYSSSKPQPERCNQPQGVSEFSKAVGCGPERVASRDCYHHKSCSECLGEWPIYRGVPQACQWCTNCQFGRCIPKGADCDEEHRCVIKQRETVDAAQCHERSCPASDCDKCRDLGRCIWTRQVVRTSELSRQLLNSPITEWNCVSRNVKDSSSFLVISMPPHACPPRCYQHQGCRECLESTGSEGGWHECRWSTALGQCIAPSYQALQCIGGMCGAILQGSSATCPRPCSQFTQCSTCHQQPHCGWCSLDSAPVSGIGLCVNGNLEGPFLDASCAALDYSRVVDRLSLNISHTRKPSSSSKLHHTSNLVEKVTSWHYQECPLENECLNGHHTCDAKSERCVDRENGYACICSEGYVSHGSVCRPVCSQGCVHGDCVEPNICRCHFGFVGINCSIQCKCNGHSECAGPDQLDVCLDCRNNTIGPQCSKCKPLFVGDPRNNGQCISCYEYCNGHTHICHGHDLVLTNLSLILLQSPWSPAALNAWTELIQEGPKTQAVCHACANLTMGEKCEECIPGNFRGSEDRRKPCRPCECHGHGDMCHPVTGEGCNCHNNTESDPQCRPGMAPIGRPMNGPNGFTPPPVPCWSLQCDKCKEYYLGTPTQGHQCYRQMTVDTEFCLDPETQEECNRKPTPLHPRRPVFFAIQPKFMNVDIRLVVDIALGGVDIYFAPKDDMFIVKYDSSINGHRVDLDPKYVFSVDFGQGGQVNLQHPTTSVPVERLVNTSDRFIAHPPYGIWERKAVGLTTFLTVDDPNSVVIVRGLKNRLVLTLPKDRHDLRTTRFYILVQGAGNVSSEVTFGSLFFRQDQPRIDLFVFFSVFFSCFFLFLAVSVVAWKAKHVIEGRRARERQAVEMMHMARRPFASVLVIVDTQNGNDNTASSGKGPARPLHNMQQLVSPRRWKLRTGHPHSAIADPIADALRNASDVRPIAVEPTADNFAAIVTLLVQLPGGRRTRNQLSLASSLVLPPRSRSSHATTES